MSNLRIPNFQPDTVDNHFENLRAIDRWADTVTSPWIASGTQVSLDTTYTTLLANVASLIYFITQGAFIMQGKTVSLTSFASPTARAVDLEINASGGQVDIQGYYGVRIQGLPNGSVLLTTAFGGATTTFPTFPCVQISGSLVVDNAAATTLGAVNGKVVIYSPAGAVVGYLPLYNTIT